MQPMQHNEYPQPVDKPVDKWMSLGRSLFPCGSRKPRPPKRPGHLDYLAGLAPTLTSAAPGTWTLRSESGQSHSVDIRPVSASPKFRRLRSCRCLVAHRLDVWLMHVRVLRSPLKFSSQL